MSKTPSDVYAQEQQRLYQQDSSQNDLDPVPFIEQPAQEELLKENDKAILSVKDKFCEVQDLLEKHMRKFELDIEIYYHDEIQRKDSERAEPPNEDILAMIDYLNGFELTSEFFETSEKIDQENGAPESNALKLQQQIQNRLEKCVNYYEKIIQPINFKSLTSELIKQVVEISESQAEAVWIIIKRMEMLRFKVDNDGEILHISSMKNRKSGYRGITYKDIKNVRRVVLKMEGVEFVEKMIFGLYFLLENCLENVSSLCLNFNGRYICNKEAENLKRSCVWQKKSLRMLALEFTGCNFEDEDIPLIFFKIHQNTQLEDLEGFTYCFGNTNITQKTVKTLNNLVVAQMRNLKSLKINLNNLEITDIRIFSFGVSELRILDMNLRKTALGDNEMIHFSEEVLPKMKNLSELRLWLNETMVTDKGLVSLLGSIKENIASQLTAFVLGISENNVTDEGLEELASHILPFMKNLEEFKLSVDKTLITDKSLFTFCKNLKYFAPKLRIFALDVTGTAATDKVMNALASVSLHLMKKLEVFQIWFNKTTISDQGLYNFYSSAASSSVFCALEEFEIDCSGTDITDQSLAIFANKVFPKMTKLTRFNFYANRVKIGDLSLKPLFQSLGKTQLQSMMISLEQTEIGKQSILALAETLSSLRNLTEISLWLNKTKLEDSSISRVCASLKSLAKNLECLRLGLDDTGVTDQGVLMLGNEITPEMKSLEEFQLGLSRTQIGDLSLKPLFENLKETAIENIQFWLSGSLVGDQSLLALANLRGAESLKSVTLEVEDTEVTDVSMVPLMSNLGNILNGDAKKLNFSFKRTKITTEAIKIFSEKVLENLRSLQNFKLCLEQDQAYASNFYTIMPKKAHTIRQFEMQFNKTHSESTLLLFAERILPNLVQVQDFKIWWTIEPSYQVYKALCLNSQKTIKNIKTFYISRFSCFITSAPGKHLEELNFELNNSKIIDMTMQEILAGFQAKFSTVKVFSFMVRKTNISLPSIKRLSSALSIATNLESLAIDLEDSQVAGRDLCDTGLWQTFEKFSRNLKSFKVNLNFQNVGFEKFLALGEYGLAHMTEKLETLCLDFGSNIGNGQSLEKIFGKMKNCVANLETFSLSLHGKEPFLPMAIKVLTTDVFPNLRSVKNFQLKLEKTKINDENFAILFSGLKDGVLKNVKSFVVIFEEEDGITSESFDFLSTEILGQLKNVENFECHLSNNEGVQDANFLKFNKKLQEISNQITKLNLRFCRAGLSGAAINEFACNTLGRMRNLKDLVLDFGMNILSDEAIVNLFGDIAKIIGGLSSLDLCLPRTGITDMAIQELKEKIVPKMNHLDWFGLNMALNEISEENKLFIADLMKK